jgi:hypothetical protein
MVATKNNCEHFALVRDIVNGRLFDGLIATTACIFRECAITNGCILPSLLLVRYQ